MGKYAREADNAAKSCKSRGSHLRVHFKVSLCDKYVSNLNSVCEHTSRPCNVFTVVSFDK